MTTLDRLNKALRQIEHARDETTNQALRSRLDGCVTELSILITDVMEGHYELLVKMPQEQADETPEYPVIIICTSITAGSHYCRYYLRENPRDRDVLILSVNDSQAAYELYGRDFPENVKVHDITYDLGSWQSRNRREIYDTIEVRKRRGNKGSHD